MSVETCGVRAFGAELVLRIWAASPPQSPRPSAPPSSNRLPVYEPADPPRTSPHTGERSGRTPNRVDVLIGVGRPISSIARVLKDKNVRRRPATESPLRSPAVPPARIRASCPTSCPTPSTPISSTGFDLSVEAATALSSLAARRRRPSWVSSRPGCVAAAGRITLLPDTGERYSTALRS